MEEKCTDMWG